MKNIGFNKDKKLADRGWADMRRTLDREMPAERRKRRFFWWWFSPVLLALAGLAFWYNRGYHTPAAPEPSTAPVVVPTGPVAERPMQGATPSANPAGAVEQSGKMESRALTSTNDRVTVSNRTRNNQPLIARQIGSEVSEPPVITASKMDERAVEAVQNNTTALNLPDIQSVLTFSNATVEPLALPFGSVESSRTIHGPVPAFAAVQATPARHKKDIWDFGATASVGTRDFTGFHDASLGLVTDFKLSRHWGLRSGISYGYEQLAFTSATLVSSPALYDTIDPDIIIVDDIVSDPTLAGSNYVPAQVQTQVSAVHRLEMPLMIWWQPVSRWRLWAGGSISRTLLVQTGKQTVAVENIQYNNSAINDPDNRIGQLANQKIDRWRGAAQCGISFRPLKNLEFGAMAQNRFTDPGRKKQDYALSSGGLSGDESFLTQHTSRWRFHVSATLLF